MLPHIEPQNPWPGVQMFCTTRAGGVGHAPFDSLNLGLGAGDDPDVVLENREILRKYLPGEPCWLKQVHGAHVVDADDPQSFGPGCQVPQADAAVTTMPERVLAILTADCLPVVMADDQARVLGVAHAGWRGLAGGVLEATLKRMQETSPQSRSWRAWVGPAIGSGSFQVGDEVRQAFIEAGNQTEGFFVKDPLVPGKWLADLAGLAHWRLTCMGVGQIELSGHCTVSDSQKRFFSYRRDGQTGRMATLAWLSRT